MSTRKGDWRDLLGAHSLAVDAKNLWMGFVGALGVVLLIALFSTVYGAFFPASQVKSLGVLSGSSSAIVQGAQGHWILLDPTRGLGGVIVDVMPLFNANVPGAPRPPGGVIVDVMPLFNPFAGNVGHFVLSLVFYLLVLGISTYYGGVICRVTALKYGRDEMPSLREATAMVRDKRKSYYFCPVIPLLLIVCLALFNIVLGLIGSIPVVGPWVMILANIFAALNTVLLACVIVLAVLSYGMMLPALGIGGKSAFEGFSTAYGYVLWGLNRFICYTALAALLGAITTAVAAALVELFIGLFGASLDMGLVGSSNGIVEYGMALIGRGVEFSGPGGGGLPLGGRIAAVCFAVIVSLARFLVLGYAFSYFYSANTIICLLMRKHVDRIEIDEIYKHKPEEEEAPTPPQGGEASSEGAPQETQGAEPAEPAEGEGEEPEDTGVE